MSLPEPFYEHRTVRADEIRHGDVVLIAADVPVAIPVLGGSRWANAWTDAQRPAVRWRHVHDALNGGTDGSWPQQTAMLDVLSERYVYLRLDDEDPTAGPECRDVVVAVQRDQLVKVQRLTYDG